MLKSLKNIYLLIPDSISEYIIKIFNLNPYFQKKTWERIKKIGKTYQDLEVLEKNLINLRSKIKRNKYYKQYNIENIFDFKMSDSEILRNNFESIIERNIKGYLSSTGGSGRKPSKLFLSNESYYVDLSYLVYSFWKLGYKKGDRKLTLRGVDLKGKLYKYNPIYNELQINIFLMSEENIESLLKEIEKFNPNFGHGYPSAFIRLSQLLKNRKLNFQLKGICLASESFNETQREIIEKVFKCKARGFYGHSERAAFANEKLEEKGVYEVFLNYGLIEIIKEDGSKAKENERGEIVCTGFINEAMPLIRYKTGDFATVNKIQNGIVLEIKDLIGRWGKDFVYNKNGHPIPTTAINIHSDIQYQFKYIQLYQKNIGDLIIKLVPWDKKDEKLNLYLKEIKRDFENKLKNINIIVKLVEESNIYISHRGKIPYLITEIKINKREICKR